jgi:hypothetical protein
MKAKTKKTKATKPALKVADLKPEANPKGGNIGTGGSGAGAGKITFNPFTL